MESTLRKLRFVNVIISFDSDIKTLFPIDKKNVVCYENQILESIFNDFLRQNKISLNKNYFLYLKRKNKIMRKLNKQKQIYDLKLKQFDEILVSNEEFKIFPCLNEEIQKNERKGNNHKLQEKKDTESKEELIKVEQKSKIKLKMINDDNSNKKSSNIINIKEEKPNIFKKQKEYNANNNLKGCIKNKIIMILIGLVIGILLIGVLIFLIIKNKNKDKKISINILEYNKEKLIIKKSYPLNLLLRFDSIKETVIQIEGENNSIQYINETYDFIFIVKKRIIERDQKNHIEKEFFKGYLGLLNHTIINETDSMITVYDKKLNEYLNNNKINDKSDYLKYVGKNGNLCFAKIEFYLNGEIKNFYLPKGFSENNFVYIEDISQLIIPKISSNLFSKNISEKMEEILSKDKGTTYRRLVNKRNKKYKKYKKYKIPFNSKDFEGRSNEKIRRLEEMNYTEINYTGDILVEENLKEPLSESINVDLREANERNIILDNNETKNFSQLTQYSLKNIENEEVKMEGSLKNISIFSIIDEKGILESVEKKTFTAMFTPDDIDGEEDSQEEKNTKDMQPSLNEKEFINNNKIKFNLSSIFIINTMIINRTDYFQNESLNDKLYEYFDDFKLELYIVKNESINEIIKEDENEKRDLQEEESYYGFNKINYVKDLYNYNLLGLKMQKQIFNEINPKKGTISTYFVMIFGNKNIKIKVDDQQTNLHIILEKKNKMAYNLLLLLDQSNLDLIERNKKYLDIIINMENNITNFLQNYDYSEIFKDSLENLSSQINNFSGELVYELILLIDRVSENYTYILNNIMNDDYDFIYQIIIITREEYIKYIYNMNDIIERFENNTMNFFKGLEQEIKILEYFHIDILYDIIDIIHDANLIFKKFNKNLFKSIEKGILTFKYKLKDFVDEIMGDILYIVDFLSINLNKNELFKKTLDYEERKATTKNLQNIKDVIILVIEKIIVNINKDYELQMRLDNNNGIKNYSLHKEKEIITNTEEKSNKLIKDIKSKINNIELYELYSQNLDFINNIINKTITEFINNIHNNILIESLNLKPLYFDEESYLMKNRQSLFLLSENISKQANLEINEINEFIFNYTGNFKDKNIYNIYYNLYYFKQIFNNEQMNLLLDEFIFLFNNITNKKINEIKEIIDNNFNLANEVLNQLNLTFKYYFYTDISFCTGFINRYNIYKKKFNELLGIVYKDDFSNLLEKYFFKLKNDIIEFIENKIYSINKYYFNKDLFYNNFKFIEDIKKETLKIIENLDNYFNEINFMNKIKIEIFNIYNKTITPYHNKKIEELDNYYKSLEKKARNPGIMDCTNDIAIKYSVCKKKFIICFKYGDAWNYRDFRNQQNINLIKTEIIFSENDLIKETDNIINKFTKKFEKYLSNNIQIIQNLYSNLYQEVENKINNTQINTLLFKYKSLFDDIMSKNYFEEILHKFNKEKNIEEMLNYSLCELEENINLLNKSYYQLYFLPNFENFIEYPEEIIYKINQFQKELIYNSENLIKSMNYLFLKRMENIVNSTNSFINNFITKDLKYILININSTYAIEKYWINIFSEINTVFNTCFNNSEKIMKNIFYDSDNIDLLFLFSNYNNSIKNIINKSLIFIHFLENLINETFIISNKNCTQEEFNYKYNNSIDDKAFINGTIELIDTDLNILLEVNSTFNCNKEKKHIDANYSKYNYNILKIRTGIYYTKALFENIDEIFDNLNIEDLININKIKYYDNLLNDKNILNFYNETNYKFDQIIKKSNCFIEQPIQNLIDYIKNIYLIENDYHLLFQHFKEIIAFENKDFENHIIYKNEEIINKVSLLLNQFNKTLFSQIYLNGNYHIYNLNETYFKLMYLYYFSLINDTFKKYKRKINSLNIDYNFYNIIKKRFKKYMKKKKEYYKEIINNYSKKFNFVLFDNNFFTGENLGNSIQNEINDYEFTKVYDYVEILIRYEKIYKNKIMNIINILESKTIEKFDNIYNYLFFNFNNSTSKFINIYYVQELKKNYTLCKKYENYDIYNYTIEYINYIFDNCSINDEIIINSKENFSLNKKIDYIRDNKCIDFDFNINESFHKNMIEFIDCFDNNFYNFSTFNFNNFDKIHKEDLLNNIKEIIEEIRDYYIDYNYLYEFFEKNYELAPFKKINFNEVEKFFQDIENKIYFANKMYNDEIINHISNSLIFYFNSSYTDLFNNFIINELIDNITIIINNKIHIQIDYILKKTEDEFNYYLLILNNTEEIGENSKNKLINLYENINKKINETLFYLIENNIYFYLDLFYKENKNNFINNFINYYLNESNQYSINLNKYSNLIKEIVVDKEFNKTIDKISKNLIYNIILNKLKIVINDSIYNKAKILIDKLAILKKNIENNLNYIKTQELPKNMIIINDLILNFTDIVNNQNNVYLFKISSKPIDLLFEFIHNNLKPPLLLIKNEYNKIEENFLNEIIKIIDDFPDYYSIIKDGFDFETKINNIITYFEITNKIFMEYINILNKDLESYINKFIHLLMDLIL